MRYTDRSHTIPPPPMPYLFSPAIHAYLRRNGVSSSTFAKVLLALEKDERHWVALFIEAGLVADVAETLHDMMIAEYPRDLVELVQSLRLVDRG